jgi:hypothetical protein
MNQRKYAKCKFIAVMAVKVNAKCAEKLCLDRISGAKISAHCELQELSATSFKINCNIITNL